MSLDVTEKILFMDFVFYSIWLKDIKVCLSNKSERLEKLLVAQIRRFVAHDKKCGLSHTAVKTELMQELPSRLIACHALIVPIVMGLLQTNFRDLTFKI